MNPFKKLAGQTAIYGIPTIVGRLLNYLLVPLFTYNFSTQEFGVYTEMYAYVSFLLIILTYGMETALFNFSRLEENKEKVYSVILLSVLFTSALFFILIVTLSPFIASAINHPDHPEYIIWFGAILSLDAISSIAFAKLREQQKAKWFAFVRSMNIIINIGFNIFFIVVCPKIYTDSAHPLYNWIASFYDPSIGIGYAFISNLIASTIVLLFLLPAILRIRLTFDYPLWKRTMAYTWPLLIAGLAGMTNETFDRAILKYLLPEDIAESQLGIYGACYKISIIMTIFIQTFRYAAEPFFFSIAKANDSKQLYADTMKFFVIVCSFIFLGTMVNISWIQFFVGKDFRAGLDVVPILLMANLFLGMVFNLSIWYKLTGKTSYGAWITLLGAVITLIGNFVFIPAYGYMASAWTTLICYVVMVVASYIIGNKHYPVNYNLKRILGYLALSVFLYFVSTLITLPSTMASLIAKNGLLMVFLAIIYLLEKNSLKRFNK